MIVAPGTYQESLSFGGKDIELASSAGVQFTSLDVANTTGIEMGPNGSLIGFAVRNGKLPNGGAVSVSGSNSYIADNVFEGNVSRGRPETGSITLINASPVIERNIFRGNVSSGSPVAPAGGLIDLISASSPMIANNLFHDNQGTAITLYATNPGTSPVIVNNTIVRTRTGIVLHPFAPPGNLVIRNNIIVDGEIGVAGRSDLGTYWQHNLVYGNSGPNYYRSPDLTGTNGNISADPLFLDSAHNDFRIPLSPPAVDAGSNTAPPLFDFAGTPRPTDGDGDGKGRPRARCQAGVGVPAHSRAARRCGGPRVDARGVSSCA